jgi:hypothetical protein
MWNDSKETMQIKDIPISLFVFFSFSVGLAQFKQQSSKLGLTLEFIIKKNIQLRRCVSSIFRINLLVSDLQKIRKNTFGGG